MLMNWSRLGLKLSEREELSLTMVLKIVMQRLNED